MGLRDHDFGGRKEIAAGISGVDLVSQVLEPMLSNAQLYRRSAGYFSSAIFSVASVGIHNFVSNGGQMKLLTSHAWQPKDQAAITRIEDDPDFAQALITDFEKSWEELDENEVFQDHARAMCWMIQKGLLEIRVVTPSSEDLREYRETQIFHQKFGLVTDANGDQAGFTGSANESLNGWLHNSENLSIVDSWSDQRRVNELEEIWDSYWNGSNLKGWKTTTLPEAVRDKLIRDYAPKDLPNLGRHTVKTVMVVDENSSGLWKHQHEAVNKWIANDCVGLLEMATGTGKTIVARECIRHVLQKTGLAVVVVPYQEIANQWMEVLAAWNPISVGSQNANWRTQIKDGLNEVRMKRSNHLVIVGVKDSISGNDFQQFVGYATEDFEDFLLVGDEVHWLGSPSFQRALFDSATCRLGLSATPERYFDPDGTSVLADYFGGKPIVEIDIKEALTLRTPAGNPVLCPYEYHPVECTLSEEEFQKYQKYAKAIAAASSGDEPDHKGLEAARNNAARVIKKADSKFAKLEDLLKTLGQDLHHAILYCHDTDQLEQVAEIINQLPEKKYFGRIDGSTAAQDRRDTLKNLAEGSIDVVLAMKVLDEGVDVPNARLGIILASSGNPREFIQRRGRLMRTHPDKQKATIYDFCVIAKPNVVKELTSEGIQRKEATRVREFADAALNRAEIESQYGEMEVL